MQKCYKRGKNSACNQAMQEKEQLSCLNADRNARNSWEKCSEQESFFHPHQTLRQVASISAPVLPSYPLNDIGFRQQDSHTTQM